MNDVESNSVAERAAAALQVENDRLRCLLDEAHDEIARKNQQLQAIAVIVGHHHHDARDD